MEQYAPRVKLSENFWLDQFLVSQTASRKGIDNTPDPASLHNLHTLAEALEKVKAALGHVPIVITSGYRSPALNAAVGGSKTSAHMQGLAADVIAPQYGDALALARAVADIRSLPYDQLIHEKGSWLHIGLAPPGRKPRGELLTCTPSGSYLRGLLPV